MIMASKFIIPNMSKLEPLDGTNYTRCRFDSFYLEQISVTYVVEDVKLPLMKLENINLKRNLLKMMELVKGMLLYHMYIALQDIYMMFSRAKDILDALMEKYGNDDAWTKRYCLSKWLNFHVENVNLPLMKLKNLNLKRKIC